MATESSDIAVAVNDTPTPYNEVDDKVQGTKGNRTLTDYEKRGYKPVCCGNSGADLIIITACLLVLWGVTALFFVLLLRAALETDDTGTALWTFFGTFFIGVTFLGIILSTTAYEDKLKAKQSNLY